MNTLKIFTVLFVFLISNACCSQKEKGTTQKETSEKITQKSKKEMLNQGYTQASVVYDKEKASPCSYLIKLNDKMYLEPLRELKGDLNRTTNLFG